MSVLAALVRRLNERKYERALKRLPRGDEPDARAGEPGWDTDDTVLR